MVRQFQNQSVDDEIEDMEFPDQDWKLDPSHHFHQQVHGPGFQHGPHTHYAPRQPPLPLDSFTKTYEGFSSDAAAEMKGELEAERDAMAATSQNLPGESSNSFVRTPGPGAYSSPHSAEISPHITGRSHHMDSPDNSFMHSTNPTKAHAPPGMGTFSGGLPNTLPAGHARMPSEGSIHSQDSTGISRPMNAYNTMHSQAASSVAEVSIAQAQQAARDGHSSRIQDIPALRDFDISVAIPNVRMPANSHTDIPANTTLEQLCVQAAGPLQGRTVSLGHGTPGRPVGMRVSIFARRSRPPNYSMKLIKKKRSFQNRLDIWNLASVADKCHCYTVAGAGITLCNGNVGLPKDGYWIFTARRAMLQDFNVKGGTIVVAGSGAHLTLSQVTLERCQIVVIGGATLTMLESSSEDGEVGVFVSDTGSSAEIRGCSFSTVRQCLCVQAGARMLLAGVRCHAMTITGVECRGTGTALEMQRCSFGETLACRAIDWDARAVYVHSGARATLSECYLTRAMFGIWVEGSNTQVEAEDCRMRGSQRSGALVANGAAMKLSRCGVYGSREFHGVEVGDPGTHVTLTECHLQSNCRCGIVAYDQAQVTCSKTVASNNIRAAFKANNGARIRLEECKSKEDEVGLSVRGPGAAGEAVKCVFDKNEFSGVKASEGGMVTVVRCEVYRALKGPGVAAYGSGTRGELRECVFEQNKAEGVVVSESASLVVVDSRAANNRSFNFYAAEGGHLRAERCMSEGARAFGDDGRARVECVGCD